ENPRSLPDSGRSGGRPGALAEIVPRGTPVARQPVEISPACFQREALGNGRGLSHAAAGRAGGLEILSSLGHRSRAGESIAGQSLAGIASAGSHSRGGSSALREADPGSVRRRWAVGYSSERESGPGVFPGAVPEIPGRVRTGEAETACGAAADRGG